jgi:hypothetical protein
MKRIVLFLTLLLAAPSIAAVPATRTITTRVGKSFYECKILRIHPDGVSFTHRDGAAKIAFKDLPESLRREFRYAPEKATAYQREQEALRQEELKRQKLREIAMEEKLMEAQMAEASYLAAANAPVRAPMANSMSLALPGESLPVLGQQTPSLVGPPITGPAMGGPDYRRAGFSSWGAYPWGGGFYQPIGGHGYPYGGYGFGHAPVGAFLSPTIYRSWNVGSGFRIGLGISPFGSAIRVFP